MLQLPLLFMFTDPLILYSSDLAAEILSQGVGITAMRMELSAEPSRSFSKMLKSSEVGLYSRSKYDPETLFWGTRH